ncbi:MAG TPA: peptide ABC transporter substrate-binding protein [Gaiellaceae bacterium]|nr:peptide ABC transporter substrate-binding protein [Gaiellaceae bacterium]
MSRKKVLLLVMGLFGALAIAAAGCGGGGEEAGGTGGGGTGAAANQVLRMAWSAEPPSLDPGLALDTTSSNVLLAIMDPLIRLNQKTNAAEPSLAESWDVSDDGKTVTYHLSPDGKWTNGDPVTAGDFVYSWKRTLSPELAADYAYQLYGIVGAFEYNSCTKKCDALADKVGVEAPDDTTLVVHLTSAQPWFVQQSAHHSFLAVHQATVEQFGDKWTEPGNIVTNGPFKLAKWEHEAEIDLVKNDDWRDAKDVKLTSIPGKIIVDGTTKVQAFESGEVDALDGGTLPPDETARLKDTPEYENYPSLGTYYYGFNIKNISDIHERRALSLAINRREIIDQIAQADQLPATGMSPKGISGFDVLNPNSPWTPEEADLTQAKDELSQAASPKKDINLFFNNAPGHKEIATAVQAQWKELGINSTLKQQEWAQYLEFLGPPPNNAVDVYRLGWIYDFPDAINGLELWTCDSGNNNTNFCDKDFDALVAKAKETPDDTARFEIYKQLEDMLFGQDGALPIAPIYWYTLPNLEKLSVKDTFFISPLDQIDFTKVVVKSG